MDPLLRLTLALTRLTRRHWTRTEAAVALGAFGLAVLVVVIERFGLWPEWMQARRAGRMLRW